ncbi:MAG: 30S ribosomal protein S15 [Parcubacteria group bacterium]|nr:30S ribosomal protein S15 [Parcubacteria group bacterium]
MLTTRQKQGIIKEFRLHDVDSGSASVQVAVLSRQIDELARHLKKHAKDNISRRGLLKMVGHRRRLLDYLNKSNAKEYNTVIKKLGLKK